MRSAPQDGSTSFMTVYRATACAPRAHCDKTEEHSAGTSSVDASSRNHNLHDLHLPTVSVQAHGVELQLCAPA
eukprot:CAMPEP_0183416678 /NCGR_PEP_ID=MMETSP0370-20130417/23929_1 /TAXON_ID=268820 /ORGANISM="Peridinium aciculiferum, Strain PAER-2" /LENGTH=72 /DNA_ID=CAMNT_0025600213 /DNA_START=81 /DNA_END=295 /DNA_ORIENTATION=+